MEETKEFVIHYLVGLPKEVAEVSQQKLGEWARLKVVELLELADPSTCVEFYLKDQYQLNGRAKDEQEIGPGLKKVFTDRIEKVCNELVELENENQRKLLNLKC